MPVSHFPHVLLAQAEQASESTSQFSTIALVVVILAAVLVLPFVVGKFIAKSVRMPDHGWKIGLIFCTLACGGVILWFGEIKKGIDLQGGVILIYEVDDEATLAQQDDEGGPAPSSGAVPMSSLIQALNMRINPAGTKEIVIRAYGDSQVEIIIPEVDPVEIERIKEVIVTAGFLEFRIVANQRQHAELIALAKAPENRRATYIMDDEGDQVAMWAQVARDTDEKNQVNGVFPLKVDAWDFAAIRDAQTFELLEIPSAVRQQLAEEMLRFEDYLAREGIEEIDVLMATDDQLDIKGSDLSRVAMGYEGVSPIVEFTLKSGKDVLFGALTGGNLPDTQTNSYSLLGIMLDGKLLSAPRIMSRIDKRGQITGRFTREEVQFLVDILRAGGLPASLRQEPISENQISPLLGQDTIEKGTMAITVSLCAVLVFIVLYYRFSGVVACAALLANLLLIVALMVLLKAAFTLPGLAGLVLTVGMSVDANVLIFERIREELSRGAALRMAIRNGFARATTTIVDANVTTLITAIVLYAIGTDQIRGFAVTLILGILMSMYTAIFCSRVVFDIAERQRWITKLNMTHMLGATQIDFVGKQKLAMVGSVLLIIVGLGAVAARGKKIFDIDFTGGSSVQMKLETAMDYTAVNERLSGAFADLKDENGSSVDYTLTSMSINDGSGKLLKDEVYKVDSSLRDINRFKQVLTEALSDNGQSLLASYSMTFDENSVRPKPAATRPRASSTESPDSEPAAPQNTDDDNSTGAEPAGGNAPETPAAQPAAGSEPADAQKPADADKPEEGDSDNGQAADARRTSAVFVSAPAPQDEPAADSPASATEEENSAPSTDASAPQPADPPGTAEPTDTDTATDEADESSATTATNDDIARTIAEIAFAENPINAETLQNEIEQAAQTVGVAVSDVILQAEGWDGLSSDRFDSWTIDIAADVDETKKILHQLEEKFAATPVWPSSSKIGGKVAGDAQGMAMAALLASLLGIIGYIWVRFQRVVFGLAAVAALVHDVLITLGAIAVSYWLAGAFGFLLIEEFKISLPVVAAFLTIIGYSLNDTIVVFDRIREVRGKSPHLTGDMVNTSLNQTLSRTLLTSLTTLIVVCILYAIGGQGIHGFAYALVVGVMVGTYSSMFVASPVLLWMIGSAGAPAARDKSAAA